MTINKYHDHHHHHQWTPFLFQLPTVEIRVEKRERKQKKKPSRVTCVSLEYYVYVCSGFVSKEVMKCLWPFEFVVSLEQHRPILTTHQ